jgi:hypothetical protein
VASAHRADGGSVPVVRRPGSAQQVGDGGDGGLDGALAGVAEPHHQRGRGRRVGYAPVLRQPVQADAALAGGRDHGRLARLRWQLRDRVEPGREPGQPHAGREPAERADERLTAGAVDRALLIERLPEDRASALWNLAYDAGYGVGPVIFGLLSGHIGYPAGFALTGVVVLAALAAALRERSDQVGPS